MQLQYLALSFVILTSLVGTFFIVKTIYILFLCDDYRGKHQINLTRKNENQTEYILRTALTTTDGSIIVRYCGDNPEVMEIIQRLSRENTRIMIRDCT